MKKILFLISFLFLLAPGLALAAPAPSDACTDTEASNNRIICTIQGGVFKEVFDFTLSIVNFAAIGILIFAALATILRWNVDTYAIKKTLPALVLGVILANFSLLIAKIVIEASNVLFITFTDGDAKKLAKHLSLENIGGLKSAVSSTNLSALAPSELWSAVLGQILVLVAGVFVFILGLLLFIRNYVIYFLVGLAPLAFFSMGIPMLQKGFQMWWGQFWRWVLMAPIAVFWLAIGVRFVSGLNATLMVEGATFDIAGYILMLAAVYLAWRTPFMLGGAIMAGWDKALKLAGKMTGRAYGGAFGTISSMAKWKKTKEYQEKMENEKKWDWKQKAIHKIGEGATKLNKNKLFNAFNLYGVPEAIQKRLTLGEKERLRAARKSPAYQLAAGQETVIRHYMEESKEVAETFEDEQKIREVMKSILFDENGNPKSGVTNEKDIKKLINKSAEVALWTKAFGLESEDATMVGALYQRWQAIRRSRRGRQNPMVPPGINLHDVLSNPNPLPRLAGSAQNQDEEEDGEGFQAPSNLSDTLNQLKSEVNANPGAANQPGGMLANANLYVKNLHAQQLTTLNQKGGDALTFAEQLLNHNEDVLREQLQGAGLNKNDSESFIQELRDNEGQITPEAQRILTPVQGAINTITPLTEEYRQSHLVKEAVIGHLATQQINTGAVLRIVPNLQNLESTQLNEIKNNLASLYSQLDNLSLEKIQERITHTRLVQIHPLLEVGVRMEDKAQLQRSLHDGLAAVDAMLDEEVRRTIQGGGNPEVAVKRHIGLKYKRDFYLKEANQSVQEALEHIPDENKPINLIDDQEMIRKTRLKIQNIIETLPEHTQLKTASPQQRHQAVEEATKAFIARRQGGASFSEQDLTIIKDAVKNSLS